MYHDDDDMPVLHDFIRFHYQYPAFPTDVDVVEGTGKMRNAENRERVQCGIRLAEKYCGT